MTKSLQALVLHKHASGETSFRMVFFTRELGLVHCLCKGGRGLKKQAFLQPFTPLWLALDERHERHYLKTVETFEPTFSFGGEALFSGLYLNELLYYVLKPGVPEVALFDDYVTTLRALIHAPGKYQIESLLRRFEWSLLKASGYSFSWTEEIKSGTPIKAGDYYQFVVGEGFAQDGNGIPGSHILALAVDDLTQVECLKSAKFIMRQAVTHLLNGRELKTRSLWGIK